MIMGDGGAVTMIMVREYGDKTYEVRLALYRSGGALIKEESYSGARSISIDANVDIVKIGYKELYLISKEEIEISMDPSKKTISVVRRAVPTQR
ncbi:hypothetical protein ATG_16500 [Desulfurococcaceae archaeon AG1]|jgi:hypothetical protein|nr:hypothetical protein ATG_16500 [Desulfurococcaceae archaeon AG1]